MNRVDRKRLRSPSGVPVRLQGYPGTPRRRGSPARALGVLALIVMVVGVTAVFRHLPRGAGEAKPAAAPASGHEVITPQSRVSAQTPVPVPSAAPSTNLAVRAQPAAPAAPQPRPDDTVGRTGSPNTSAHPVKKPAGSPPVAGPVPKLAAGAGAPAGPSVAHSGGRRYQVRVGEFADRLPAEELTTRLRTLGYAVRIVGAQPFLVLVGGYLDEPTASRLVSHLRGQGFDAVMNPANAPQ